MSNQSPVRHSFFDTVAQPDSASTAIATIPRSIVDMAHLWNSLDTLPQ